MKKIKYIKSKMKMTHKHKKYKIFSLIQSTKLVFWILLLLLSFSLIGLVADYAIADELTFDPIANPLLEDVGGLLDDIDDIDDIESDPAITTPNTEGKVPNPLNVDTVSEVLLALFNIIKEIGMVVVVVAIIYTGFLFVTAQGNDKKLGEAKQSLQWVIIGSALVLGAWALAKAIEVTITHLG